MRLKWAVPMMAVAVVGSLLVACSDDKGTNPDPQPRLCAVPNEWVCEAMGSTSDTVRVTNCGTATALSWTAQSGATWLTPSASSGSTPSDLVLVADANRSGVERTAALTITSGGTQATVMVTQPSTPGELCFSTTTWVVPPAGGVSSNYTVMNCGSATPLTWVTVRKPAWVQVSDSTGTTPTVLTMTADSNKTGVTRVDSVVVSECYTCVRTRLLVTQDPVVRPWTTVDTLIGARWGHGAATVNGIIYVLGSSEGRVGSWYVEAFDPVTGQWTQKAPMPTSRDEYGVAELNGQIYAIGGLDDNSTALDTVEAYAPGSNTWSTKSSLPASVFGGAACALNSTLYFVGGRNYAQTFSALRTYDPGTNAWTTLPSGLFYARSRLGLAEVGGKLYAIGGELTPVVEEYNPATDSWTTRTAMPTTRFNFAVVALGSKIYVIGGFDAARTPLNTVEVYDPATDQWATKTPMPTPRALAAAAVLNGKIYVIGGNTAWPPNQGTFPNGWPTGVVEVYDPGLDL